MTDAPTSTRRMPLPAAVWYAVELANVMLGRDDAELRAAAGGIGTRAALLDWCERCTDVLGRECGDERAGLFRDRMRAAMRMREPVHAVSADD